jgi:hypothetical protein
MDSDAYRTSSTSHAAYVHRVKEIVPPNEYTFPIRDGTLRRVDAIQAAQEEEEASQPLQPDMDDESIDPVEPGDE